MDMGLCDKIKKCKDKNKSCLCHSHIKNYGVVKYLKDPVKKKIELWNRYPRGGEHGWIALVEDVRAFYYWDTEKKDWLPVVNASGVYLTQEEIEELFVIKVDGERLLTEVEASAIATIKDKEDKTHAANTYETKTNAAATYESKANAAEVYETKQHATDTFETKANATNTYETKTNAANTFATKTEVSELMTFSSDVNYKYIRYIKADGSSIENGNKLISAYNELRNVANVGTPDVKTCIVLGPGVYDNGESITVNTNVDIIGLGYPSIYGVIEGGKGTNLTMKGVEILKNFCNNRECTGTYIDVTFWGSSKPDKVYGIFKNCHFKYDSFDGVSVLNGTFHNCSGFGFCLNATESLSGRFYDCRFGHECCTVEEGGTFSGQFYKCTGGVGCFRIKPTSNEKKSVSTIDARFYFCSGASSCFCGSGVAPCDNYTEAYYCKGGQRCFGTNGDRLKGVYYYCSGEADSFGGRYGSPLPPAIIEATAKLYYCKIEDVFNDENIFGKIVCCSDKNGIYMKDGKEPGRYL